MTTFTLQSGNAVQIDDLVQCAHDVLADGQVTFGEVVKLGGLLAGKVSQFGRLSGHEKQAVVIFAVERALDRVLEEKKKTLPEEQVDAFRQKVEAAAVFAKETLPAVLEVAVKAAKGELDLGKAKKTCWSLVRLAFQCAGRQVPELPKAVKDVLEDKKEEPKNTEAPQEPKESAPVQPEPAQPAEEPAAKKETEDVMSQVD